MNAQAQSDRDRAAAADANQPRRKPTEPNNPPASSPLSPLDANQATAEAQQAQKDAETESARNRLAAETSDQHLKAAVKDQEELRAKLLHQFNIIFATRDTARGLVVNLSDVLFDTGKSTLHPALARSSPNCPGSFLPTPTFAFRSKATPTAWAAQP